jgi:hypothetical protein
VADDRRQTDLVGPAEVEFVDPLAASPSPMCRRALRLFEMVFMLSRNSVACCFAHGASAGQVGRVR